MRRTATDVFLHPGAALEAEATAAASSSEVHTGVRATTAPVAGSLTSTNVSVTLCRSWPSSRKGTAGGEVDRLRVKEAQAACGTHDADTSQPAS